jgi:hypothetical protein
MRFGFGKYKGREINDVPSDYLLWLHRLSKSNVREIRRELVRRGWVDGDDEDKPPRSGDGHLPAGLNSPLFRDLLAAGYKSLANKLHPDHGGGVEDMRKLNDLRERLRKEFK